MPLRRSDALDMYKYAQQFRGILNTLSSSKHLFCVSVHTCYLPYLHCGALSFSCRCSTLQTSRSNLIVAPSCCHFCFTLAYSRCKISLKALLGFGKIRSGSLPVDSLAFLVLFHSQPPLPRGHCSSVFATRKNDASQQQMLKIHSSMFARLLEKDIQRAHHA